MLLKCLLWVVWINGEFNLINLQQSFFLHEKVTFIKCQLQTQEPAACILLCLYIKKKSVYMYIKKGTLKHV